MSTATRTPAAQLAAALASLLSTSMDATAEGQVVTLTFADRTFLLAVAEQVPDPCAGLKRGDVISSAIFGEFDPMDTCEERNRPASGGRYKCNRKRGHKGVHVATYGIHVGAEVCCDPWGGDITAGPGGDKYRDFKIGMKIDRDDIGERGSRCEDYDAGMKCTLASGHAGKHVATQNGGTVATTPWSEADKSDPFSEWSLRNRSLDPTEGPDEDDKCYHDIRGDECTRVDGHSGNHVSGSGYGVRDWCRPGECG